jgi:Kef-type K+ transport system membrane component KefB
MVIAQIAVVLMLDQAFIQNLGTIVIAAAVFVLGARGLRMPTIVAYLLAGLALGPGFGIVEITPALSMIAEVGIVLLLFLVGLELRLEKVQGMGRVVLLAGLGQVGLTALGGFLVVWELGYPWVTSLWLGIALTFSSTVVAVKLLEEKREFDSLHGRIAVGVLLLQDLVVIGFLTVLSGFQSGQELNIAVVLASLLRSAGGMAVLVLVVLAAAKYVLPGSFAWAARSPETLFIWSLCWCFFIVVGAHYLHLSAESGAFLAGLSLAQLPYNRDLRRRVRPLMNFFIAVFFVSLGIQMEPGATATAWRAVLFLALFVLVGKFFILLWLLQWLRFGGKTAFGAAITLSQTSEFSFILMAALIRSGWTDQPTAALVGVVGLVTISLSSCLITYSGPLFRFLERRRWLGLFRAGPEPEALPGLPRRQGHIIVVGMNTLGRLLAERLQAKGEQVLAIDTDPVKLAGLPCETLLGNAEYLSVLEEADLARAKLLISALRIEPTNDLLAYRCRTFGVPSSIHVVDLSVVDNLLENDVSCLMIPKVDGIKLQTRALRDHGFLPT